MNVLSIRFCHETTGFLEFSNYDAHTHITPWPAIKSFNKNMHYQSLGINHYPYGSPKKDRNIFPGCFVDGVFTIISKFPT